MMITAQRTLGALVGLVGLLPAAAMVSVLLAGCATGGKSASSSTPEPTVAPPASPEPASASEDLTSVPSGSLLFLSWGASDLYAINVDGTGLTQLTNSVESDNDYAFSPDGSLIAYTSHLREDRADGVYVISPDGTNARRVSGDGLPAWFRSWSSQGKILYAEGVQGPGDYWIVNPDGSDRVRISEGNLCSDPVDWSPDGENLVLCQCTVSVTDPWPPSSLSIIDQQGNVVRTLVEDTSAELSFPQWSPDGSQILFTSQEKGTGPSALCVINADGTDLRSLYQIPADARSSIPSWSPDGSQIVLRTATQILVISPTDGSSRTVMTVAIGEGFAWSPDGSEIAVRKGERLDVVSLADGSSHTVANGNNISYFKWSPNSDRIAYVAEDDGLKLYVVDSDGGEPKVIADPVADAGIAWSPDGRQILFSSDRRGPGGVLWTSPDGSERGRLDELSKTWIPERSVVPTVEPVVGGCRKGSERNSCLSPDGKSEAVVLSDSTVLTIRDLTSGATRDIEIEGAQVWNAQPVWSNDGTRIAVHAGDSDEDRLYVVDVATGGAEPIATGVRVGDVSAPTIAWSPDDSYVYFVKGTYCPVGCGPGILYRVRPDGTGEERVVDMAVSLIYGFKP